jgi:zinc transport system ATP-binding protein
MNNKENILVRLKNISLTKNNKTILKDISFDIYKNEIVSIIWSNGAGKTSLLDIVLWLQKATKGIVEINTKKIWYVPQKFVFDLSYPLTVKEFFGLYGVKFDHKWKFEDIIKKLSVIKLLKQNMWTLSGWELQKILILLAIMKEPDILFLDEATAGIDSIWEKDFYEFLERVHKEKQMSIVLISHDIHRVFSYSDKVICLNQTVCCKWKPEHIKNNSDFTKIFGEFTSPYIHKLHKWI